MKRKAMNELIRELQEVTQQYKRVTQKRLDEVNAAIDGVREAVEGVDRKTVEDIWLEADGKRFRFEWVCSNVGCWFRLSDEDYRIFPGKVEEMGDGRYLHGDFNCYVKFMDRKTVLKVIRNYPSIIGKFMEKLEQITAKIETA